MSNNESYTTEEISNLLKVSKLTVYDLIKKGELQAYRVGRQMRVDASELENYKVRGREVKTSPSQQNSEEQDCNASIRSIIISGQDNSLDMLARQLEMRTNDFRPLRSYVGSLDSLIAMYKGNADIVSTHLFDGDTKEYNVSYIRKLLVSKSFIVVQFIRRQAGLYVAKGNPKKISTWMDLGNANVTIVNRESGAGARVLLDEQLRLHGISREEVNGYENEQTSHLSIASVVANGGADVGIGIEQAAKWANIDFVPMIKESYDLVMLKSEQNEKLNSTVLDILNDPNFTEKLDSLGYDIEGIGNIIWEH
ncbi:substrate-binding domain-containing protein [Sporosarcina sp. G11-34]|uniref:substrate-binding domain-containing protein n=1 Tax=Sporosarcina sp. G11-34 TaxID=2849605 RepID=UPI0022A90772|nr:substrate-binding domain-containing protein [Sporosarcina sp. G11-34]MCZ2259433.1 excisionase family DNA-binding protein [Sporosarcina sp. G11-34]